MISRRSAIPVWFRFALRELRGGLSGFKIFMGCLILGVMALASIGSLTRAIEQGLADQGQIILGGDIEVSKFQIPITPEEDAWLSTLGDLATSSRLRTMARTPDGSGTLVELRAVDQLYPLYGELVTTPSQDNAALFDKRGDHYGTAISPLLADNMELAVGDKLRLGTIEFEIRALIDSEPDKANQGFELGPSVMIREAALAETGLVTVGSLINHVRKIRIANPLQVDAVRAQIREEYPTAGWRVRTHKTSAAGLRRFIDRMGEFLVLVGLTALVVGGLGVGNAVTGYMDRKTKTIATLKILGAEGGTVFKVYFAQIMIIGVLSIIIGLIAGMWLPAVLAEFLPDTLPVSPTQGIYPDALGLAALYGLLITIAFTAWPLGKARDLPAVHLFRSIVSPGSKAPRLAYQILILAAVFTVVALAIGLSGNAGLSAAFLAATIVSLGLLWATARCIQYVAKKLPRQKNPLIRMAIANLHRPGAATTSVVVSLGLGLTLFASLALIQGNLDERLEGEVSGQAPAFFFVDIQGSDLTDFKDTVGGIEGVSDLRLVPNLRGKVKSLNGVPAQDWETTGSRWVLSGDRGLTYSDDLPASNQIVEGDWWPKGYSGPPQISMGAEVARDLGLSIGDTLVITVLGVDLEVTIRSFREINWGSMGFNFVIMFDPNTLRDAPHTWMATLKAEGDAERVAHNTITRTFDTVTAIRMKEVLERVNVMLEQVSVAISATAIVAIFAGVLVLAGAIAAGFRQRLYESVILKVVGAVKSQILRAYLLEYLLLGVITATIALGLGALAGWAVVEKQMNITFTLLPGPMVTVVAISLGITILFGLASSLKALSATPNSVLRSE